MLIVMGAGFALPFLKLINERRSASGRSTSSCRMRWTSMKRALRAGHPFGSAVRLVAEDMSNPIAQEFQTTFADLNYGNDVRRALLGLLVRGAERLDDGGDHFRSRAEGDWR